MTEGPRLIGRKEAADYCGVTPTCFSMWVASSKMPPAIPGTRKWDKRAIDARLDEISGLDAPAQHAKVSDPDSAYLAWRRKEEERDRFRPQLNLSARWERVLRFMMAHPDPMPVDTIPQAAEQTMDQMRDRGLVRQADKDPQGIRKYSVTDKARQEIELIDTWQNWKY